MIPHISLQARLAINGKLRHCNGNTPLFIGAREVNDRHVYSGTLQP
jgi:hypothetical protein